MKGGIIPSLYYKFIDMLTTVQGMLDMAEFSYIPDDATTTPQSRYEETTGIHTEKELLAEIILIGKKVWQGIDETKTQAYVDSFRDYIMECEAKLKSTLEGIFPGRWEVHSTTYVSVSREMLGELVLYEGDVSKLMHPEFYTEHLKCYIHFPEILITNGVGESWTILDYYVIITFNKKMGVYSIKGYRATKLPVEYSNHYTFSHSKTADNSICSFCFGSTNLDSLVAGLYITAYDEMNMELFLQNLTDYLSWESKEGVPFLTISTLIATRYGGGRPPGLNPHTIDNIVKAIIDHREDIKISICVVDNNPHVRVNEGGKMLDIVTKYTPPQYLFPVDPITSASIYPSGTRISDAEILDINESYEHGSLFTFKGHPVCLKVIQDKKEQKDESRKYADTRLVSEVAKHLSTRLSDFMYEYSWTGLRKKRVP